jgi:hypothetical protein
VPILEVDEPLFSRPCIDERGSAPLDVRRSRALCRKCAQTIEDDEIDRLFDPFGRRKG